MLTYDITGFHSFFKALCCLCVVLQVLRSCYKGLSFLCSLYSLHQTSRIFWVALASQFRQDRSSPSRTPLKSWNTSCILYSCVLPTLQETSKLYWPLKSKMSSDQCVLFKRGKRKWCNVLNVTLNSTRIFLYWQSLWFCVWTFTRENGALNGLYPVNVN